MMETRHFHTSKPRRKLRTYLPYATSTVLEGGAIVDATVNDPSLRALGLAVVGLIPSALAVRREKRENAAIQRHNAIYFGQDPGQGPSDVPFSLKQEVEKALARRYKSAK